MTASSASEAGNREFLLFTSYCGQDNPECSDAKPCPSCLGMSNVFRCAGPMTYVRELAPEWNHQTPPVREDLAAKPSSEIERLRAEVERLKAERFVLDLRIRNQRRSNRENWMIVEARGKSLRSGALYIYRKGRALVASAEAAEARAASAEAKRDQWRMSAEDWRGVATRSDERAAEAQRREDALAAKLAVRDAALEGVLNEETLAVHVGYDNMGNFVYADAVRTDSDAFRRAREARASEEEKG